jgi:hypothetical protein
MLSSWLTRIVDGLARLQVLKSAASLHLLLHFWQPLDGTEIWTLPTALCLVVFALGWALVMGAAAFIPNIVVHFADGSLCREHVRGCEVLDN